ncbi:MAG TPA: DNA internalization-related competence protein ComEC/Rec2 [Usitatibacter sp.]|nr:DNA internalization-related competence protein ComEC/Rec2 [Usitatibacter sp.]
MRLFVLAFLLGTWVLQREARLPDFPFVLAAAALGLAAALLRRGPKRVAVLAMAGWLAGYGYAAWRAADRLADALPFALEGSDIPVAGVVASLPQVTERGTRFLFDVEEGAGVPRRVSLAWYPERDAAGDALPAPRLVPGERWRFTVRLKRPRGLANPHAFDFEPWALERGIRATGYVRTKEPHARIAERAAGASYAIHRWRGAIRDGIEARLGEARLRGILVALAVGDQDAVAADDWDVFWRTGVGHLMSISGLHITMLAALAFALVSFGWVRVPALALAWPARKAASVAGVLAALAYTLMTGYAVPAQRTFVMLAVLAACILADRHGSPSRVLALAALAVLVLDPWAVLSPGFWLSFGAVAAIFHALGARAGRAGRWRAAALEQAAVTIAMLPMLAALFQQVSLVSPVANALAIPVVSFAVVPLTLAGSFLPLPALLDVAHALMEWLMEPLEWLASWPAAMQETHAPPGWTVVLAVAGAAWLLAPRGVPMRVCGIAWMAPLFLVVPPRPAPGEAWLDVLDVGQGLAVVVRTASHALVYDTGASWSPDSDSGGRIVVPFLRGEGIGALDGLVVSHADDDHAGGAASIAARRPPAWMMSPLRAEHPLHPLFARSRACAAGIAWRWDGVDFAVLHPPADVDRWRPPAKENDRSCVLRVATRGGAALLTADIEARAEHWLRARATAALRADVLLVPHHGSRTSSTAAFLDAVSPGAALLAVGHRNRFRHPHDAVLARYAERSIAMHRTDRDGALRARLPVESAARVAVETIAPPVRYWSDRRRTH